MLDTSPMIKNMEMLRQDAGRMLDDLGRLQSALVNESKVRLNHVAGRVSRVNDETRRQMKAFDETIHTRPYSYYTLAGAMIAGLIGGLLLPFGRRNH